MSGRGKRGRKAAEVVEAESPPPTKKPACDCALDRPNLTVVVDGKEFHLNGYVLCTASRYFRTALMGKFKEATTRHFEFPDRDAETFELLMNIIAPCSPIQNTPGDKIKGVLDWSDTLGLEYLPVHCDQAYREVVLKLGKLTHADKDNINDEFSEEQTEALANNFDQLLDALNVSRRIHLKRTQRKIMSILQRVLHKAPCILDASHIQTLLQLCNDEYREEIWPHLGVYLPKKYEKCEPKELIANDYISEWMVDVIDCHYKTQVIEELQETLWKPLRKRRSGWGDYVNVYTEIVDSFSKHLFWKKNSDKANVATNNQAS